MFIAALFIIARTWKQPRCPSADKWIRKLWYTYTMEYYSAIKKNSFESVLMRWMKLKPIIQSEVSQKDEEHYSIITHIYRNIVTITLYAKQKKRHRCTEQTFGLCGRRWGWDVSREQHQNMYIYYLGWNRSPAQVGCMRQVLRPGALGRPRGSG